VNGLPPSPDLTSNCHEVRESADANKLQGCDYHPVFQQIAFVDSETGELQERRLEHPDAAEKFYCELAAQGK
jgi:hypothetical protein